jgi:adenine-specific DNA-methyltransferase
MDKLDMQSPNLVNQNFEKLAELFPNCVTESASGKVIDFDLLKQELSNTVVEGNKERYRLEWPGKREAIVTANIPTNKTLRPVREDSVDFDNTENIYIEGDNLEVLKLLQESYLGKVKLIYIDPPYNTGNDFVYKDNFKTDKDEDLFESGQKDELSQRLVVNPETASRYHSAWLSMMFSRLKLARNLLSDEGLILISIDDNEVHNLRKLCDEPSLFGESSFIGQLVWKSRQNKDNRNVSGLSVDHEYVLCYAKKTPRRVFIGAERKEEQYKNPDNDPRGPWVSGNMVGILPQDLRPNCHYDLISPASGINYGKPKMGWRYDKNTMGRLINENRIIWPESADGRPRRKVFLSDLSDDLPNYTSIIGQNTYTRDGTSIIDDLFGGKFFDFPKPVELLKELIYQTTSSGDLILDFFSGSGTTAHAVQSLNSEENLKRKFIVIQVPELLDEKSEPYRAGFYNLCEIGKERIRRSAKKIKEETGAEIDYGFRVYRLDDSNMQDVYYRTQDYDQSKMDMFADNVKPDRTEDDLLAQVMLDWGLPLSLKIEAMTITGRQVFKVADNSLYACFDSGLDEAFAKEIAKDKPLRVVFRDSGFKDNSAKTNVKQLLKQLSPETEMKVI